MHLPVSGLRVCVLGNFLRVLPNGVDNYLLLKEQRDIAAEASATAASDFAETKAMLGNILGGGGGGGDFFKNNQIWIIGGVVLCCISMCCVFVFVFMMDSGDTPPSLGLDEFAKQS
jgi:hypothetical protein